MGMKVLPPRLRSLPLAIGELGEVGRNGEPPGTNSEFGVSGPCPLLRAWPGQLSLSHRPQRQLETMEDLPAAYVVPQDMDWMLLMLLLQQPFA